MALHQRRGRGTYRLVVAVEFLFLVSLGFLPGGLALRAAALILRETYGALFLIDYLFYDRTGAPLSVSVIRFAMRERENARILIWDGVDGRDLTAAAAVAGSAAWPYLAAGHSAVPGASVMVVGSSLLLGLLVCKGRHLTAATNLLRTLLISLFRGRPADIARERVPVERDPFLSVSSKASGCNVLLLIIESLCLQLLESPEGRAATPRYHAFLEERARGVTRFPLAIANSSASDISLPTLFTGLSPEHPLTAFQRQPLIWSAAKAAGYHTRFYSSQSLGWGGLSSMLLHPTLDHAVHRDSLGAPAVNDLAMDDRELNRIILADLPRTDTPFFAIVNYNMLHYPFHAPGQRRKVNPGDPTERYLGALKLFDQCFGDLLDSLAKAGRLEDTAILLTADHGELPDSYSRRSRAGSSRRKTVRLSDLRADLLRIPFWVHLPDRLADSARGNALVNNARELVSNLDIYPTILDLLGFNGAVGAELSGQSLFQELPPLRFVVCMNTGALRDWEHEPFAVASGHHLWVYHDETRRFELADLEDPKLTDVWPSIATPEKQKWVSIARSIPALDRILVRRGMATETLRSNAEIAAEYDQLAIQGEGAEPHQLDNWKLFSTVE